MSAPTHEEVVTKFVYDPLTGQFSYRHQCGRWGRIPAGTPCGIRMNTGYISIPIGYKKYLAHRLAWFYMTGEWPKEQVDHLNCIRDDNRWINLREATGAINTQNERRPRSSNVRTGFLGVRPSGRKFSSVITVGGKPKYLGTFESAELAYDAYVTAKRKYHPGCTL